MAPDPRLRAAAERDFAQKNRAFGPTVGQFHPPAPPPTGYQKDNGIYGKAASPDETAISKVRRA